MAGAAIKRICDLVETPASAASVECSQVWISTWWVLETKSDVTGVMYRKHSRHHTWLHRVTVHIITACSVFIVFTIMGHSAYFNTAVTKQDFMKILGVSSQKWCKIISYYHGDVKQTMVYLIAPSVLILIKWDVTKQDFFLVLWLNHLQLLSKIIGYYHGNRE